MTEIEAEIAAVDRQIKALTDDREALVRAAAIIEQRRYSNTGTPTIVGPLLPLALSISDATEKVLTEAGRPLHVDVIFKRLSALGKKTTKQSIVSALVRDKKRFVNLGRNTYKLTTEAERLLVQRIADNIVRSKTA